MKNIRLFILILITTTIISCDDDMLSLSSSDEGIAGSLARFTISGDYLYTVEFDQLKIFDISNEKEPVFIKQVNPGPEIESIFSMDKTLFLGSRYGVYILDISNPEYPIVLSEYSHIYSGDPVVVSGNYAYATLSSLRITGRGADQLEIIDISNKRNPVNVNIITMESPQGLGISSGLLFVCDNGIKVYDLTDPVNPSFIRKENIPAVDIIPIEDMLIITAEDGLYLYNFTTDGQLNLLSTLYSKN